MDIRCYLLQLLLLYNTVQEIWIYYATTDVEQYEIPDVMTLRLNVIIIES